MLWCMSLTIGPLTNLGLLFPLSVLCLCAWPSFLGAVLSVIKVYWGPSANEEGAQTLKISNYRLQNVIINCS